MVERISAKQFHAADGVEDWRILAWGARAYFATGAFDKGVELVNAIGRLADAANHHPDIDLRYPGVMVRLFTHEIMDLSEQDLAMAQQISQAARELGVSADPSKVQMTQIAIDALDIRAVRPFWQAVSGYEPLGDEDLVDSGAFGPGIWFQQLDAARPERNTIHVDLYVPADHAEARIAAALDAGGKIVRDNAPAWWTLADPEGNEVDIAPWTDTAD